LDVSADQNYQEHKRLRFWSTACSGAWASRFRGWPRGWAVGCSETCGRVGGSPRSAEHLTAARSAPSLGSQGAEADGLLWRLTPESCMSFPGAGGSPRGWRRAATPVVRGARNAP